MTGWMIGTVNGRTYAEIEAQRAWAERLTIENTKSSLRRMADESSNAR